MRLSLALLPLFLALTYAGGRLSQNDLKYFGAQVFRVTPATTSHMRYLNGLTRNVDYNFWIYPRATGVPVDIMAPRWKVSALKAALDTMKIPYDITIKDVRNLIAEHEKENNEALKKARQQGYAMEWTAYHDYDEIMAWVDSLATTYPSLVTVQDIGGSYEGRTMKLAKISTGGSGKPAIFIDGGMHAREWISPATVTYMMNELLSNSAAYTDVLNTVDFYFVPVINADGYAYTWSDDRLWRKTRSPQESALGCVGVDPNRNWDFHWMESGASSNPCAETFAGTFAFSENETRNLRDQMLAYSPNTYVYLTYHSYGQYWLYPWGYDTSLCSDWEELDTLANNAVDALTAVYGTVYSIGGSGALLYPAAGASDDYAKGVGNIKYSYTVELRDTGRYGFELPADQIIPSGIETFASLEVIMNFVRDTYGK